ncbi:MAG TPA: hypothetical protein PK514_14995 [Spirochaetota bacterium]|nr:hypothetical protein [Spirochaetota bacterium]
MKAVQGSPGICARCSTVFGSCCVACGDDDIHHTFVSEHEAALISGLPVSLDGDPLMSEPNSRVFINRIGSIFPDRLEDVVKAFPVNKTHRSLAVDCFGRCTLLGSKGCVLEKKGKPLFCRIYPFWFINGVLVTFNNDSCLALRETSDINELMKMFSTDEERLGELYSRIVSSWLGVKHPG